MSSFGGRLWYPHAVLADEGICQHDEFAHDGCERDFGFLADCSETFVKGREIGVYPAAERAAM